MQIGEIARLSGFTKDTLRYYEKIGLIQLDKKQRGENNYRFYDGSILKKLAYIKKMKGIGFTLNEIKEIGRMGELDMIACSKLETIIQPKIAKIEQQIIQLQKQKAILQQLSNQCTGNCATVFNNFEE